MTKLIDVELSQLNFPSMCVVCMSPAWKQYEVSQVYSRGRDQQRCGLTFQCAIHTLKLQSPTPQPKKLLSHAECLLEYWWGLLL